MDDSGHSSDPNCYYVGMGGLVAKEAAWAGFESEWLSVLKAHEVDGPFHMRAFSHGREHFKNWSKDRKQRLLGQLLTLLKDLKPTVTGCVVDLQAFRSLPDKIRTLYREPYYMALQHTIRGVSLEGLDLGSDFEVVDLKVNMVFAEQREFGTVSSGSNRHERGDGRRLWDAMKSQGSFGRWMGEFTTDSPASRPALQAADLFTYELTKEFENRIRRPSDQMRWALQQLLPPPSNRPVIQLFDKEEVMRIYIEATGQESNPIFQEALTLARLHKLAMRNILEARQNAVRR